MMLESPHELDNHINIIIRFRRQPDHEIQSNLENPCLNKKFSGIKKM